MTIRENSTGVIRGLAALSEMLDCIGERNADDHKVAQVLVENELHLRSLLAFGLDRVAEQ